MNCPHCDSPNLPGTDTCEQCGQSLSDMHPPIPTSDVEQALLRDQINQLSPKTPIVVEPSMPIRQALKMLVEYGIGCVIVVKESRLVGIFTERDALVKLNTHAGELGDRPIAEFMTENPQTLDTSDKIAFAVQKMDLGGYRHIPLMDDQGRPTGIISVRDILNYLTDKMMAG